MTGYIYRGTSLSAAKGGEFWTGRVKGQSVNIYKGRLDTETPQATVARGTPVEDLPWWSPEGFDDQPYMEDTQGVTGGFSSTIGTSIGFGGGVPLLFYLNESKRDGGAPPVQYRYRWFDQTPGALAWVYGDSVDGEVRTEDEGLIGLTTMTESGPEVWEWGDDKLERAATQYENEHESLAFAEESDIQTATEAVATVLESQRGPRQALDSKAGYTTNPAREDGKDISGWTPQRAAAELHKVVLSEVPTTLSNYWVVVLSTTIMDDVYEVPGDCFEFAYDGADFYTNPAELPSYLLGE